MSDIKAGDLVMIKYCPCKHSLHQIGWIHQVISIVTARVSCNSGGRLHKFISRQKVQQCAILGTIRNCEWALPLTWLKRIPPLSELKTMETKIEETA